MSVAQNEYHSGGPDAGGQSQLAMIVQELRVRRPHLQRAVLDAQMLERVAEIEQATVAAPEMASLRSAHGDEIERLAVLDPLTEVYNVKAFFKELKDALRRGARYHSPVSLGLLAVDGLEELTERFDRLTGEAISRIVGNVIRNTVRESDIPARYTAERFAIVFPETTLARAAVLADRLCQRIGTQAVSHNWKNLKITASVGLAAYPVSGERYDELIAKAGQALDLAVRLGGDHVCAF